MKIFFIILVSLIVRLAFAPYLHFGFDEHVTYAVGHDFFVNGIPPFYGVTLSTGSTVPGMLQGILTGIPLFFSKGEVIGAAYGLVLWTMLGLWLLFCALRKLFTEISPEWLAVFVFFAPWTIMLSSVMNPHYLLLFAVMFYVSALQLAGDPEKKSAHFAMAFSIPMMFQLHLSAFLPLAHWMVLVFIGALPFPKMKQSVLGFGLGSLLIVPAIIQKFFMPATNAVQHSVNLASSIAISAKPLLEFPRIFFRFLSFSTGDTTRFVTTHGYLEIFSILAGRPILMLFYFIAMLVSAYLVWLGLCYFKRYVSCMKACFGFRLALGFSVAQKRALIVITSVCVATGLFAFASRSPSAQTIWVLFPLAMYVTLAEIQNRQLVSFVNSRKGLVALVGYLAPALIFSICTYISLQ